MTVRSRGASFLWGGLALVTGLPFLGAGIAAKLLSVKPARGLPLVALLLFALWYLAGFHGAGTAAAAGFAIMLAASRGYSPQKSLLLVSGTTLAAGSLLSLGFSGYMNIGMEDLEPLREIYLSAGIEPGMIDRIFGLIVYYAPGIGAAQLAFGAMAALMFFRSLPSSAASFPAMTGNLEIRVHWAVAWIPILCLAAIATAGRASLPEGLERVAGNMLVFMILPYFLQGAQVAWKWARGVPGMAVLLVIGVFFATPVVSALVLLAGILDPWFDFRKKLDKNTERTHDEDPSDKER